MINQKTGFCTQNPVFSSAEALRATPTELTAISDKYHTGSGVSPAFSRKGWESRGRENLRLRKAGCPALLLSAAKAAMQGIGAAAPQLCIMHS